MGSVTVGERGQVVIPAEARDNLHLAAGDKLLAFMHPGQEMVCLCRLSTLQQPNQLLEMAQTEKAEGDHATQHPQ